MYGDRWTIKGYAMRTAGDVTLPLAIDRADPRPLPRQLADELRTAIGSGLVAAGEQLVVRGGLPPRTRRPRHRREPCPARAASAGDGPRVGGCSSRRAG